MSFKIFQLHKRSSYTFNNIQDKFCFNENHDIIAIADGTTQSFKSELWAEILTKNFSKDPKFNKEQFISLIKESVSDFNLTDFKYSENPAKAYLEKQKISFGATTTFLGIKIDENFIEIISCGDSNVFVIKENGNCESYPFNTVDDLDNNKDFINTEKVNEIEIDTLYHNKIQLSKNDKVIVCTDALSRLLLSDTSLLKQTLILNNYNEFFKFCTTNWEEKKLQEDDITLVLIDKNTSIKPDLNIPNKDFEFEKEKEYQFIPSQINENNMHNYNDLINSLKGEFTKINKKITRFESLIMILIFIGLSNLFLTLYFNYFTNKPKSSEIELQLNKLEDDSKNKNDYNNEIDKEDISDKKNVKNEEKDIPLKPKTEIKQLKITKDSLKKDTVSKIQKLSNDKSKKAKPNSLDTLKKKI